MMLTTSYAWYSFETASTTFSGVTTNDDIKVSFESGQYINTNTAIPISSSEVSEYADKNTFLVSVLENSKEFDIAVSIFLTDIVIDAALKNEHFKVELLYRNNLVKTITGDNITGDSIEIGSQNLSSDIVNSFEVRVYILDDDSDQSKMMNKKFQAKVNVNVVSRIKVDKTNEKNLDIVVTKINIDGVRKNYLPTEGYYNMTYSCVKGSKLSWEPLSKTLTYNAGSVIGDNCTLNFTKEVDYSKYPRLSEMPVGSYVKYVGNNGCTGKSCEGQNANYVSNTNMGYCYSSNFKFYVNGWRIAYIENGSAFLVSAGAPECVNTYVSIEPSNYSNEVIWTEEYFYGSGYEFDELTGKYSLTGITSSALALDSNYKSIIANTPYTCKNESTNYECSTLYRVGEGTNSSTVEFYTYKNYDVSENGQYHVKHLDDVALTYCNDKYIKNGSCDASTVWAMDVRDFNKITRRLLSECKYSSSNMFCGYTNDLIDNGGYYWYAVSTYDSWNPASRQVLPSNSERVYGVRPVLSLDSSIIVTDGSGTMLDPYVIDKG